VADIFCHDQHWQQVRWNMWYFLPVLADGVPLVDIECRGLLDNDKRLVLKSRWSLLNPNRCELRRPLPVSLLGHVPFLIWKPCSTCGNRWYLLSPSNKKS
jgi:hypothetical protein